MIAVIADDITGAAEIAGVGLSFGMRVALVFDIKGSLPEVDLLVYATDTRSLTANAAVEETNRVIRQLKGAGCDIIFKKTDSALRGHVVAELEAILQEAALSRAIYVPENPSKGRIVRDGIYYIDEIPLDRTGFAHDPEYPAFSADVRKRLPGITEVISSDSKIGKKGIFAGNAENKADIEAYLACKDSRTLFAGGADLFSAYLGKSGWKQKELPRFEGLGVKDAILICGSTVQHNLTDLEYFKRKNVTFMTMPQAVFDLKTNPQGWFIALNEVYELHHSIAISVGHPIRKGAKYALRLRNIMALAASSLVDTRLPDELIIEGGATAFAVLKALGWNCFRITDEIAPGVVRMALTMNLEDLNIWEEKNVHITLKPGSYPWGDRLFQ